MLLSSARMLYEQVGLDSHWQLDDAARRSATCEDFRTCANILLRPRHDVSMLPLSILGLSEHNHSVLCNSAPSSMRIPLSSCPDLLAKRQPTFAPSPFPSLRRQFTNFEADNDPNVCMMAQHTCTRTSLEDEDRIYFRSA